MVSLQEEVELHLSQWTPLQRELHSLVQLFVALPNFVEAGMDTTSLMAKIRAGIAEHGGSFEAIKQLYTVEGVDFNPDEEIWDILKKNL